MSKKVFNWAVLAVLFLYISTSFVSAQEATFAESIARLRDENKKDKDEIIATIMTFNGAFEDTFKLLDDEISRLIYNQMALVGVVFAISFLVYARTTSKTRKDVQKLLIAHSKQIDTVVAARLDAFMNEMKQTMKERDKTTLNAHIDSVDSVIGSLGGLERIPKEYKNKLNPVEFQINANPMDKLIGVEEVKLDSDGKVLIPKESSNPLNKFKKRIRNGLRKILGMKKKGEVIVEMKKE